jgi:hypothetical protein
LTNAGLYDKFVATLTRVGVPPSIAEAPRMAGPAPSAVERGDAVTVWLTGMGDRYVPNGLMHVRLCEPETMVTTHFVTVPGSSAPMSIELLREAIQRTSEL